MKGKFAKVAYGVGNLGQALFFNSVQTFLIFFYTDMMYLDPKLVGLGFSISYVKTMVYLLMLALALLLWFSGWLKPGRKVLQEC